MATPEISEAFSNSPWYAYILFVLLNLQAPPGLSRSKAKFLKLKEKYFVSQTMHCFGKIMVEF